MRREPCVCVFVRRLGQVTEWFLTLTQGSRSLDVVQPETNSVSILMLESLEKKRKEMCANINFVHKQHNMSINV